MLARSSPKCPTFVLGSSSEPERARPVDLPGVYSSVLFSRILNDSPLRALVGVLEFVAVEDILPSEEVEAGKHTRDPTRLRIHGVFPVGVLGRRPLARAVLRARHYGPEKPIWTPPGARTIAMLTPSIIRVGGNTSSAPSRNAFSKAS